jgi:hypothetical protein
VKRQLPQIVAIERQNVEGVELDFVVVLARVAGTVVPRVGMGTGSLAKPKQPLIRNGQQTCLLAKFVDTPEMKEAATWGGLKISRW